MKERFSGLSKEFDEFQRKSEEFIDILVIDGNAEVIYKGTKVPEDLDDYSIRKIYKNWVNHKDHNDFFEINGVRYVILKRELFQFCAINIAGGKGICGSITKKGNYCLGFLKQGSSNSLIVSSVVLNKWIWDLI
jgi:hypothetical protein